MIDFDARPILVFWETTRACLLACRHCRADAISEPLPGELTTAEGLTFIDSLRGFEKPYPVLVLTGGDVLMRHDLLELVRHARSQGIPVAVSPSVTPKLKPSTLLALRDEGVKAASLSLDGASAETHDGLRGITGHFDETLDAIELLGTLGFTVQVNTVVRPETLHELPEIVELLLERDVSVWEVFFLVRTGRGADLEELTPAENEEVCHFLLEASRYGMVVRTVEAPFFRRVAAGPIRQNLLTHRLHTLLGPPHGLPKAQTKGTRDGKGIVFVAHDGEVFPAGFLPVGVGNVREHSIVDLYRESPLLRDIRAARFSGRCGACVFADLCGGSRARAYASSGDPLGEDPACANAST
ncbi:MAG: TIGR04053 family radical SAM/SPASM domain-containing protein [Actinomycetota bacterium]